MPIISFSQIGWSGKILSCRSLSPFLSPLEVEELDAIDKDKEEKEDKANMGHNNSSQEVIFKAIMGLQVIFYCQITLSRYLNWSSLFTHLRGHKPRVSKTLENTSNTTSTITELSAHVNHQNLEIQFYFNIMDLKIVSYSTFFYANLYYNLEW